MCRTDAPSDDDMYRRVCRIIAGRPFDRHWLTGPKAARSGRGRRQLFGTAVDLASDARADRSLFASQGTGRSASAATCARRVEMLGLKGANGCLLAIGVALAGCAVGPDFERPAAPDVEGYTKDPLAAKTASA